MKKLQSNHLYLISLFMYICYSILFVISSFTLYIDYYTFTINSLIDKLNRFFLKLIEYPLIPNEFIHALNLMEKFIHIKTTYLKDFCYNNSKSENDKTNSLQFNFNKFCSFGTYFFNNINTLININTNSKNHSFSLDINYNFYKFSQKMRISTWKNYLPFKEKILKLNKFFCIFFNSKLISWKTNILMTKSDKENTCRVCDKILSSKDFILHSWFCKEIKFYIPKLTRLNNEILRLIEKIEKNYHNIYETNNIFDHFFNLDLNINSFNNHSCFNIIDKIIKTPRNERKNLLLSSFIMNINKEKDKIIESYTKQPYFLLNLNTILFFSIKIFSKNHNCSSYSKTINSIFSNLFKVLMKKQITIEYIIIFKEIFQRNQNKIDKSLIKREISENIDEVTYKLTAKSFKFERRNSKKFITSINKNKLFLSSDLRIKNNNSEINETSKRKISTSQLNIVKNKLKDLEMCVSIDKDKENQLFISVDLVEDNTNKLVNSNYNSENSSKHCSDLLIDLKEIDDQKKNKISKHSLFSNYTLIQGYFPKFNSDDSESISNIIDSPKALNDTNNNIELNLSINDDKSNFNDISINDVHNDIETNINHIIELLEDFKSNEKTDNSVIQDIIRDKKNSIFEDSKDSLIKISNFQFIRNIGKGGYGSVGLYKKTNTGDEYAIKIVNISKMKSLNVVNSLENETDILNLINHDFLVKCYYIFSDNEKYYFVMENIQGGDLSSLMNTYKLKEETIKLLVAEIILALEYLHSNNIIHRDLKPENILLSNQGHLKLIDFGLSELGLQNEIENNIEKQKLSETKKILGTANYIAPEIIIDDGEITEAVDYWALGIILYELFTEALPFYSISVSEIFDNIVNSKIDWEILKNSEFISENAYDLIKKFLEFEKDKRWSSKNIKNIKEHNFFKGIDWQNIKKTTNLSLKKYVCEKIKKESLMLNEDKNGSEPIKENQNELTQIIDFCSKKIDNLYEKNLALIKSNINGSKKLLEVEFEGLEIKDFIDDLDY